MRNEFQRDQAYLKLFALASEQDLELQELRLSISQGRTLHHVANDRNERKAYDPRMNDISREELGAKLETIEVKMDARVESVSGKIDGFLAAQSERDKRIDVLLGQISTAHNETKAGIGSLKTTLVVTAVSTVLAIVIGVASFNSALTSNMMAAFQVGLSKADQPRPTPTAPPSGAVEPEKKSSSTVPK